MTEKVKRPQVVDAISFVSDVVRSAYWSVAYHQDALKPAYAKLKWARELALRVEADPDVERADTDEDGEVIRYQNLSQFVMEIVNDAENTLGQHETALVSAHNELAYVLTMLARGNYSEIDIEEVQRQVRSEFSAARGN